MPFPLPLNPAYRREIVWSWIGDIAERVDLRLKDDAETSWKIANEIYLSLPPGEGCEEIESALFTARVKLDQMLHSKL